MGVPKSESLVQLDMTEMGEGGGGGGICPLQKNGEIYTRSYC